MRSGFYFCERNLFKSFDSNVTFWKVRLLNRRGKEGDAFELYTTEQCR